MRELGLRMPNMTVQHGPAQPTALTFQIRGQVQNDILGTLDPSVGFYDDWVIRRAPARRQRRLRRREERAGAARAAGHAVRPQHDGRRGPARHQRPGPRRLVRLPVRDRRELRQEEVLRPSSTSPSSKRPWGSAWLPRPSTPTASPSTRPTGGKSARRVTICLRAKVLYQPFAGLSFLLGGQYIRVDTLGFPVQPSSL